MKSGHICSRFPRTRTGFPIEPPITRRTGDFALPTISCVSLPEGEYEVCIDSTLADGHLTYGGVLLAGAIQLTRF